ncbi:unnamed protein product [Adineta ricciae]|uniref:MULE transposase domain-containing protein n=1 Tax=Adineta ricciae TaxID=249248 RepID=A0A813YAN6_ADIRI|nr:unnamed protein product [Adineta ricciae]CAF1401974.1 unnamed protein product [Adineta ricciae]
MKSKDTVISDESSFSTEDSSLSSSSSPKPVITTTKSNKRKTMLVIDGYHFQLKDFNSKKTVKFWRCAHRKCGMLLHTTLDDGFLQYSGSTISHSHLPDPAQSEIRNLREKMRERAENEVLPLQEIAEQEVRKALLTGEALAVMPRVNDIESGRHLTRARRKMTPALPQSTSFTIPDMYTLDYRNVERLLLHDSDDPKHRINLSGNIRSAGRVLVWSSDTLLNLLFNSAKLHMDGTFSSAPPMFHQVVIIQAFLHETCIPVVYALLCDRKAVTYMHLLNVLSDEAKRMNKTFNPSLIMTDFEPGIAKAISMEFTEKTIQKGCFFHLSQNVYKHVQSLGLSALYLDDLMIRSTIRQVMALALVPEQYVASLFAELGSELREAEHPALLDFLKYFTDQWMHNTSMWNVFGVSDRTNNYSEGYKNRFKKRLHKSHPNIWLFIDSIRNEVCTTHDIIFQINSGMEPRIKRPKTRLAERRIEELYRRFEMDQITARELLRGLSLFVAHKK